MMCRHELGSLQGPASFTTTTENRAEKQPEDGPRAKFLCSFGGSILPRPSDGKLRYAGGETRMVSVSREISYCELMAKMAELSDQASTVKYQQPDDDMDALVSVVCDDDVANLMEEYDRLQARGGFSWLRLFLFPAAERREFPSVDAIERDHKQRYVDALNGLPESSKQPEMPVIGNGIEAGVAQHVAAALPVSSVKPLFPVAFTTSSSSSASPPSSPCHPRQVPVHDQYYPRKSSNNSHYGANNDVSQRESYPGIPGASDAEFPPQGQFDINTGIHNSGFVFDREYKENAEALMANAEASGNLPQISPQVDWQHSDVRSGIEISKDRGIPDHLPIQFNMQHRAPPQQQQMLLAHHQAAGHSAAGVYSDHELVYRNYLDDVIHSSSLQKKPFLRPLVRQEEEKQYLKNDNAIERSWSAAYYDAGSQISHNFSSLLHSGSEADYHGASAPLACQVDFGNAYQQHMQVHWACDEYGNRADYSSDELSRNFLPLNSCPAYNSHMCSDEHVMLQHQQPVFLGEDTRFQGQNLNHLQSMFDGNSATELHYASVQAREDLSEVWSSNSYQQHLPPHLDHPGSNKVHFQTLNQGGEYHPAMSKELSTQNASAIVDQRVCPVEQTEPHTNFQDGPDKARGWVLNQTNHRTKEVRMPLAGKADGLCVPDKSMHRDFGQNNYWGCYSGSHCCVSPADSYHIPLAGDFYKPVISNHDEPQTHAPVIVESGTRHGNFIAMYGRDSFPQGLKTPELENCSQGKVQCVITGTHLDCTSGVHLQPNNGESLRLLGVVEERGPEAVSGENDGQKIERMECPYVLYGNNAAADVPNVPCYMPDDLLLKNINNSDDHHHHFMGPHLAREIEDIKSLTVVSIKEQAGFEHGALTRRESNVFVAPGSNKVLPDHSFSCVVTSTDFVHDRFPLSSPYEVLPSVTSSSPPRSNILTSISPPVYDQSPANSTKATVPEDFWSDREGGREVKELDTKVVTDNNRMRIVTRQLEVEVNSNDSGAPRQNEDVDKGMPEACLNDKVNVDICGTSRPMDSSVHHPNLSSSPVTLGSNEVGKQTSPGSAKEVVNKEDRDEVPLPISDTEEELGKREVPEHYPSGVDEDSSSGSVENAKSMSSRAELEALARGLQTIRNADLEEIRELGSGTYGTVYHGKWKGSDVAIKRIKSSCFAGRPSERERLIADFWKEASILSQLHHPNVVSFYGVVRDGPGGTLATVTEFMVNGSLKQVLHKKDRTIDRRKRLIIAMDAAFGMEYLHGKNIVHFDLKCENLLVNMRDPHRPVCKIGDMGLSKVKHQTLVSGGVRGTLPWMAPELLTCKSGMVTDKIDVYSFGIVMWELLTGDEPYANMHCGSIIGGIMNNTLRPPVPSWCDPAWRSLMERCWSSDPGQRPSFSDIAKELRALAASINLK